MKGKIAISVVLAFFVFSAVRLADAQQPKKVQRIGLMGSRSAALSSDRVEALVQGLRELGYKEGENITFEYRWQRETTAGMPGS